MKKNQTGATSKITPRLLAGYFEEEIMVIKFIGRLNFIDREEIAKRLKKEGFDMSGTEGVYHWWDNEPSPAGFKCPKWNSEGKVVRAKKAPWNKGYDERTLDHMTSYFHVGEINGQKFSFVTSEVFIAGSLYDEESSVSMMFYGD